MTYEYAVYFKLLLLCGYKDELAQYVDVALAEQDPLSDIILELATTGPDDKKILAVLNEYLLQVKDSDIDYDNAVFDLILSFLKRKYMEDAMPMKNITRLMYRLSLHTNRYLDDPWYTMYLMDDLFDDAEIGFISKADYQRTFDAFINDKVCVSFPLFKQPKESFFKRIIRKILHTGST